MIGEQPEHKQNTEVGILGNVVDTRRAAWWVAQGGVIGSYFDGVDTLWVNGRSPDGATKIQMIKGEKRKGRPLTTILEATELIPLLDRASIPQTLRPIFLDEAELNSRLGAIVLLRLPVLPQAAASLPDFMTSRSADGLYWLQSFLTDGNPAAQLLVRELKNAGVDLPAATSMNVSGQPEIADQEEALAFSRDHGLNMLLQEPHTSDNVVGSYPILGVGSEGAVLLRQGHFPGELFRDLLDTPHIDMSQTPPPHYPIREAVIERFKDHNLRGRALRQALLEMFHEQ